MTDTVNTTKRPSARRPSASETRVRRRDGELTRQRVLEAAIASILEVGYYQSSSNEIARRAGVTWGVLQHQFGSREALLLEVLNDRWERLQHLVACAEIRGATLEERLHEVLGVLEQHYGQPEHLVTMQIGLDLANNPSTSTETRRAVRRHAQRLSRAWRPLCVKALGESAAQPELVNYAFTALRGYLVGNLIASSFSTTKRSDTIQRDLLIDGISAAVRAATTTSGSARDGSEAGNAMGGAP